MKLNHYETTLILNPSLPQKEAQTLISRYKKIIKEDQGKVLHEDHEGIKNLAYPIQKRASGIYYIIQYQAPNTTVEKLEKNYRIDENIMRFLSIKLDKHGIQYHQQKKAEAPKTEEEGEKETPTPTPTRDNRKKYCRFKKFNIKYIDYKEKTFLMRFINPQGKILPRRLTGNSAKAQRMVNQAIKRARHIGRIPFVADNLK